MSKSALHSFLSKSKILGQQSEAPTAALRSPLREAPLLAAGVRCRLPRRARSSPPRPETANELPSTTLEISTRCAQLQKVWAAERGAAGVRCWLPHHPTRSPSGRQTRHPMRRHPFTRWNIQNGLLFETDFPKMLILVEHCRWK